METIKYIIYGANLTKWVYQTSTASSSSGSDNIQLMDPLSCMIRLAILYFKPEGTKISIHNNKITYQVPSLLQGPIRWSNGDNRNDLHNLFVPISLACEIYNPSENREIYEMYNYTVHGLQKLKKSYSKHSESNLVIHCLNHYIDTINEHLIISPTESSAVSSPIPIISTIPISNPSMSPSPSLSPSPSPLSIVSKKKDKNQEQSQQSQQLHEIVRESETVIGIGGIGEDMKQEIRRLRISRIYERCHIQQPLQINFDGLWIREEIHIIHELLRLAEKKKENPEKIEYLIHAIENILEEKDTNIRNLVLRISNSV